MVRTQTKAGAKARAGEGTGARAERKAIIRTRAGGGAGTIAGTRIAMGTR